MGKEPKDGEDGLLFSPEDLKFAYGSDRPVKRLARKRKVVLIIEDDFYMRGVLEEILKRDFDILLAEDGEKGCDMAMKYDPDLILLDLMMPKLSGKETLMRLRSKSGTNHIQVIIMSGSSRESVALEMSRYDVKDFIIQKPFRAQEFLEMTRSSLGVVITAKAIPAVLLYENKAQSRDEIRTLLVARELVTMECETLKQLKLNFKRYGRILDGVIYSSKNSELKNSFVIQEMCETLKIPCFSVEEYLKSPEDFEKLVRQGASSKVAA